MPRLISRLLKSLENTSLDHKIDFPVKSVRQRKSSLRRPLPSAPSFSPLNRTQSILLDDTNPIIHSTEYVRHKSLPPNVINRTSRSAREVVNKHDEPRCMTEEERSWWASPYLRMLSSPIRSCMATERKLPSDFLVRLAPMRIPTPRLSREAQSLLPDGLEHPKFKSRRSYIGTYVICWKESIQLLADRGYYRRLSPNLSIHSLLVRQIGHLLRVRVLQELELLADKLQHQPQGSQDAPLIRRLTRAEWKSIKATGIIPYENAVAVVVVPPLNRNPITKTRPEPSVDAGASDEDTTTDQPVKHRPLPPLSALHPTSEPPLHEDVFPGHLPSSKIPLYNGLSLFPLRSQRAALHARLTRLLLVERRSRYREHGRLETSETLSEVDAKNKWVKGDQKASHAFLLCSDEKTVKRGDMAATAIALWRVRMWEGAGWEEYGGGNNGWELRQSYLSSY